MTPYQQLAAYSHSRELNGWHRTAPLLRQWAASSNAIPEDAQMEAICTHVVRVGAPLILEPYPELAAHTAALRTAPCAANWESTVRRAQLAWSATWASVTAVPMSGTMISNTAQARNIATNAAAFAAWDTAREALDLEQLSTICWNAKWAAIRGAAKSPDPRAAFEPTAESWIALALPPLPRDLLALGVLDFTRAPADGEAYAVAWDFLGDGDEGTGDAVIVRDGMSPAGDPVPLWARRTALARCLVRLELSR